MHSIFYRLFAAVVAVVSMYFAVHFSQNGFQSIQHFKQLERIVPSSILGLIPGEAQVSGFVQWKPNAERLVSTRQKVPSVYFRYLEEREERDSDGDTRWVTVRDISRATDFDIVDHSSVAAVLAKQSGHAIQWSMNPAYRETRGSYRYTEWRIEPDQKVTVFGFAELENSSKAQPRFSLRFDRQGDYLPIVTRQGASSERGYLGTDAILNIWGGISLFALGICAMMYCIQIHRLLVFLSLMAALTSGALIHYGVASLSMDVRSGYNFLLKNQHEAKREITRILRQDGLSWPDWQGLVDLTQAEYMHSDWQSQRITEIRLNLNYLRHIYLMQISQFPESAYASAFGYDAPLAVSSLSEQEQQEFIQRLSLYEQTTVTATRYVIMAGIGLVAFGALAFLGFRFAKVKRMIENIPTSKTKGVSYGIAELKGKVKLIDDQALEGPLSYADCVWYRYKIEEKRRSGNKTRWVTIEDTTRSTRFYCTDDEGELLIDSSDATVSTRHKKTERSGDRKYTEWSLRDGDKLYALGHAKIDKLHSEKLVLGRDKKQSFFILSNYSERDIMIKEASNAMLALMFAFSGIFFFATFVNGMNGQFSALDYLLSGLLGPLFLIGFTIVLHYNDLVFLRGRAERNWHNIQVSLKKRATLFRQLEKVVAKYLTHEQELLTQISKIRTDSQKAPTTTAQASDRIETQHRFLETLDARVEAYPELKSDAVMRDFSDSMAALENEVSLMRQGFNDAVTQYNTRIQSFPDIVLASMFKFERLSLLSFDIGH